MEKRRTVIPLKPVAIQTRLALSMVYQVRHKLKIEKWMTGRDIVDANPMIFDRIRQVVRHDYQMDFTMDYNWRAADMLLEGMKYDRE